MEHIDFQENGEGTRADPDRSLLNVIIDGLLPGPVRSLFGQGPSVPSASHSVFEHELKFSPLGGGAAKVVLEHRKASGPVHEATFSLGDAKKRNQFAAACLGALGKKLTVEELGKLGKDIEEELLWNWQQLQVKEKWRESEAARPPADKLHEKERRAGKAILKSPGLLYGVTKALEGLGLAGETVNALLLYLAMTSRLGEKILSVVVKAESASGKSFLTDTVLKLFPPEAYISVSSLSSQALYYDTEDYRHRMLVIAEAAGIKEEGEYSLRTLLSENKLTKKSVGKDSKGGNKGETLKQEGPTGLIMTTTKARMNLENETRYLSIGLDESEEQTERIKDATAKEWETVTQPTGNLDHWLSLQRMLEPVEAIVPFAKFLSKRTPKRPLRIRRDFTKLLLLIGASATLHQSQRKKLGTNANGTKVIEASVLDYFLVKELFEKLFFQSLHGIYPKTREVMDAIKKLYQEKISAAQPNPTTGLIEDVTITTQELVAETGMSKTTVLKWAEPLKQYQWIVSEGDGIPTEYRPGIEPDSKKSVLPTVAELLAHHTELGQAGRGLEAVHPITGRKVDLRDLAPTAAPKGPTVKDRKGGGL